MTDEFVSNIVVCDRDHLTNHNLSECSGIANKCGQGGNMRNTMRNYFIVDPRGHFKGQRSAHVRIN